MMTFQCKDGGWAAFDKDCTKGVLEKVPFADHNAMLDPACADITTRIFETFGAIGFPHDHPAIKRAFKFVKREQEADGSWFGRWGVNYIYGTWQVLCGLRAIGRDMGKPYVLRAVDWLKSVQNADGGWGETCESYSNPAKYKAKGPSTASQTSWAVLGLLAAGEENSLAAGRGIQWLLQHQNPDGTWTENQFTGTGFPKVFYLKYHLYRIYFPLLALSMYSQRTRPGHASREANPEPLQEEPRSKRLSSVAPLRQAVVQGLRMLRGTRTAESRFEV
jgi:squalene-hopene/tetraprenyl-beta-curcumene cyclase